MWKPSNLVLVLGLLRTITSASEATAADGKRIFIRLKPEVFDPTSRMQATPTFAALANSWHLEPLIQVMPRSSIEIEKLRKHRLLSYYALSPTTVSEKRGNEMIEELMLDPTIDLAYEEPEVVPASMVDGRQRVSPDYSDCDASYAVCQKYMLPPTDARDRFAVGGVNAFEAHKLTDVMGDSVTIMVMEIGKPDDRHEDLKPLDFVFQGWEVHFVDDHSTMSAGVMVSQDNGYGVTGIAPNARFAYAKFEATEIILLKDFLKAGDVLQVGVQYGFSKQQIYCPNTDCYLPVEDNPVVKDSLAYLTQEVGVHVVIAAANAAVNLDHPYFGGKYGRELDSWVIYAGALDPKTGARASFSQYGDRVDLCSWGTDVSTTYWNDAYTTQYSGTSSANPIIAGCVAFVQSVARAKGLGNLAPNVMRQILVDSGHAIPRANSNENIGSQPDLVRAVQIIEQMAGGGTTYTTQSTTTTSTTRITATDGCASCSLCVATSGMSWDDAHCAKCANGAYPVDWPCQTAGFCKCSGAIVATTTTTTSTPPVGGNTITTITSSTTTTTKGSSTQGCASCSPCVSSSGMSWDDDHCAKCANGAHRVDWPCQTAGFCRCR